MTTAQQPICEKLLNGTKYWSLNGILHREDGPAIERACGAKHWYIHGTLHRADGPAIERASGTTEWFNYGKWHRADGPAVEYADGTKSWYFHGKRFTSLIKFCDAANITGEEKTLFLLKWS